MLLRPQADEPIIGFVLRMLGINVQTVTAQVGLNCTAVSAVGVTAGACPSQLVCCQQNNLVRLILSRTSRVSLKDPIQPGLVSIGCTPAPTS